MTDVTSDEITALREEISQLNRKVTRLTEMVAESSLDSWRGRIEQLKVQAHLGQMELRDEAESQLERVDDTWMTARHSLDDLGGKVGEAWDELVENLRPALANIRNAFQQASRTLER